eukprot:TRINITY_DN50304_c0_g1_i1.p1 TRINITY_DN50304_c0_g1~~TRINITY_DN50304_c0_g1_i1.p1  ORF type:complete len:536 (-),score=111.41 TRINITY_DN50304_c0_g1_i1:456-2063(-)
MQSLRVSSGVPPQSLDVIASVPLRQTSLVSSPRRSGKKPIQTQTPVDGASPRRFAAKSSTISQQQIGKHLREVSLLLHTVCRKVEHVEDRLGIVEDLAERVDWGDVDEGGNFEPFHRPPTPTEPRRFHVGNLLGLEIESGDEQEETTPATHATVCGAAASNSPNMRRHKSKGRGRGLDRCNVDEQLVDELTSMNGGQHVSRTRSRFDRKGFASSQGLVADSGIIVENGGALKQPSSTVTAVVVPPEMEGMSLEEKLEVYKKKRQLMLPKIEERGNGIEAEKFVEQRDTIHRLRRAMRTEVARLRDAKHSDAEEEDADALKREKVFELRRALLSEIEDRRSLKLRKTKTCQMQKQLGKSQIDGQNTGNRMDLSMVIVEMEKRFQRDLADAMKSMEERFNDILTAAIETAVSSLRDREISAATVEVEDDPGGKRPTQTDANDSVEIDLSDDKSGDLGGCLARLSRNSYRFRKSSFERVLTEQEKKAQAETAELVAAIRASIDAMERAKEKAMGVLNDSVIVLQRAFRARRTARLEME